MSTSSVRVGIRIRPLVSKEKGQAIAIDSHDNQSIVFKGQTFTFDHVFGSDMSQMELYERTAASMLKNVLEGYNCTIIAYGQTGSGKTFTMGTSDVSNHDVSSLGLIPRFVNDLFQNLNDPEDQQITYKVKASFLEIYGEDVYDLLVSHPSSQLARSSLAVREDEHGHVFVQGQIEQDVSDPESALEALSVGSSNRITAATAMNAGSSRSHAVFTLSITQFVKTEGDDMIQNMTSKLTFVDLAGSERIKRTGAEGQRMKEGIQINSGLFNLGQVINSLADEQKLKAGQKPAFVPYRNSKLTHLLKDALGGNSQTLFLACVSPAESNESETYSTLSYARQARNIQNKPVKNMDETQAELRRLKLGMRTWMLKAVKLAFCPAAASAAVECAPPSASKLNGVFSPGAATLMAQLRSNEAGGTEEEALLQRPEVIQFIEAINASIKEKVSGFSPSPRKVRLSLGMNPALRTGAGGLGSPGFASPRRQNRLSVLRRVDTPSWMPPLTAEKDEPFVGHGRESILFGLDLNSALEAAGNNVSDSQVLIERMLDVISEEKRILGHQLAAKDAKTGDAATVATESTGGDATAANDSDDGCGEDEEDEEELKAVDKLIAEKEEILSKLMENIKGYSALKAEFEKLVEAINSLETEKKELEAELEKAKKGNQSSAALEKIKERFTTVKEELRRMKDDRKNKEQAYKMMQKESKALDTMQRELQKLKESKVSLLKQQKTQFNELQKMKKEQAVKLQLLKKSDVKKQQQMNALKSELVKKERIIGHRDKEIGRMAMKLKACEDHITQLLKIQNRSRQKGAAASGSGAAASASSRNLRSLAAASAVPLDGAEAEHLATSKGVLDQAVLAQVDRRVTRLLYEKKTAVLRKLNQALVAEAADLEALLASRQALLDEHAASAAEADAEGDAAAHAMAPEKKVLLETCEQSVKLAEAKIERLTKEIDLFNADIDDLSLQLEKIEKTAGPAADAATGTVWDTIGTEIVLGLSAPQAQALLLDSIAEKVTLSTALRTAEAEVALLLAKVEDEAAMKLLLAAHVEELRAAHRERLVQLEKQRLEDVWAMMKASSGAAGAAADDLQQGVLFQKARALELQLEDETTRLGDASAQLATAQEQLERQSRQLAEMDMRLQVAARVSAAANDSNAAQGGSASGFLDADYLKRLQQLWEDTGLALDERHVVMDCLLKSQELAKERALSDAERALRAATEDFAAREASVQRLLAALGDAVGDADAVPPPDWAQLRALPKIAAVARLDALQEALAARFDGRAPELRALRDQLDYYVAEMWLQREDLSPALQQLARLPSTAQEAQWERDALVALMAQHALSLSALTQWHDELKALNLQRVRATASLIALRDQCLALCAELGLLQPGDAELAQLLEQVFGEDADVPPRARSATVQILTQQTSSNPPGAQTLLVAFDKLKLLLESVRLNRSTVSALLCRLHGRFVDVFRDTSAASPVSLAEACDRARVEAQTQSVVDLAAQLAQLKQALGDEVCEAAAQLGGDRPTAAQLATSVARNVEAISTATAPCLQQLEETVEELGGMEVFVEEAWLQRRVAQLLRVLPRAESDGLAALARDCLYLKSEKKRLETLRETFGELQRTDAQLVRHIAELEDFEERSKADRAKALSGSSKMLVEEEKFRRNGKKKYEAISEKMLALHAKLQTLLGTATTAAAPLDVRLSLTGLSGPGQCLLRGGVSKERVELMRLHTAAAAAAAATALTSPTHAPSAAAAAAAAAAPRRSSDNASAKGAAGSAKSGSSKENAAGAANRSQLPVVGGKGALKSASAASRARAAPKTTGHQPVSASSALSSLASLAIENPLTFAAELGSGTTPKAQAAAARRYSFQPPTPPQTHADASDSSREASPAADEAADKRALWSQIDTVTPSLGAEDL